MGSDALRNDRNLPASGWESPGDLPVLTGRFPRDSRENIGSKFFDVLYLTSRQRIPLMLFPAMHRLFIPLLFALCASFFSATLSAEEALTFEEDIRPILKANCFHCHGEEKELAGGLDL